MADQKVVEYIKENSSMYPKDSIKKQLKSQGHSDEVIKAAFEEAEGKALPKAPESKEMNNVEYAGFWIRFLAIFIDWIILGAIGAIFAFLPSSLTFLSYLIAPIYYIYMHGNSGQTIGKMVCGIKVVDYNKNIIGFGNSTIRYIMSIVSGIILGIGYIMAAFDEKKQSLHDKVAKTYVIYNK